MNYLIVADTHLGIHGSSDVWHEIVLNLFKEIHDTCIKKDIKTIIHLGDFFHNRKSTNVKTQEYAHRIADIFLDSDIALNLIVGNHDTYYKNKIHPTSVSIFRKYNHINIIDKPTKMGKITCVPWGTNLEGLSNDYLMGHFEINGFHMNNTAICQNGMSSDIFQNFCHVFSGHFHTPSENKNITYLGSPYQQTFHDVGSRRGFYIFNDENGELEFIEFEDSPKFIIHEAGDPNLPKVEGNIIKLVFKKDFGTTKNKEISDEIISHNPLQLRTDFSDISDAEVEEDMEENISDIMDPSDILKEFVKKTNPPKNIKVNILSTMIDKLIDDLEV